MDEKRHMPGERKVMLILTAALFILFSSATIFTWDELTADHATFEALVAPLICGVALWLHCRRRYLPLSEAEKKYPGIG